MTELFSVELEARSPEMVEVAIVEVAMVDAVIMLLPIKVVFPPCKASVLLFRFSVPLPLEIVLLLKVLALSVPLKVKAVPEAVVKVVWPVTLSVDCKVAPPSKTVALFTVRAEVEALPKAVWPDTPKVPEIIWLPEVVAFPVTKEFPATVKSWLGVLVPRPKRWLVAS